MSVFIVILLVCVEKSFKPEGEVFFLLLYDCASPPRGSEKTHFCMKPFSRPWAVILHFCSRAKSKYSLRLRSREGLFIINVVKLFEWGQLNLGGLQGDGQFFTASCKTQIATLRDLRDSPSQFLGGKVSIKYNNEP